jgi:hypothetical protein
MKTLKFFTVLAILAFFSFGSTSAQNQKVVYTWTNTGCWDNINCVGETLCGDINVILVTWNNKWQWKFAGTLEGQTSHDLYTWNQVNNESWNAWEEGAAGVYNSVQNVVLNKKGGPAIVFHVMYHITVNANGEVAAEFDKNSTSCD